MTKYQLFHFHAAPDALRTGMFVADVHYDLTAAGALLGDSSIAHLWIDAMLEQWGHASERLGFIAASLAGDPARFASAALDAAAIQFAPPVARPGVIYGAGANYRKHVEAMARAFNMKLVLDPKAEGFAPWHFIKPGRGTLAAHRQTISYPAHTQKLDWEAELAVIIGRRALNVTTEDALQYVAGYSCANDLSARDNLFREVDASSPFRADWIGHKCFTGACPLGAYLTPAQFVGSPENLGIKLWVNDVLRQDSNTNDQFYTAAEQIAYLSSRLELFPGDVLITGTPAGVGMESGTFLKRGDTIRIWIENVGELETRLA